MFLAHSMNGQDDMSKTVKIRYLDQITHRPRYGRVMAPQIGASCLSTRLPPCKATFGLRS